MYVMEKLSKDRFLERNRRGGCRGSHGSRSRNLQSRTVKKLEEGCDVKWSCKRNVGVIIRSLENALIAVEERESRSIFLPQSVHVKILSDRFGRGN